MKNDILDVLPASTIKIRAPYFFLIDFFLIGSFLFLGIYCNYWMWTETEEGLFIEKIIPLGISGGIIFFGETYTSARYIWKWHTASSSFDKTGNKDQIHDLLAKPIYDFLYGLSVLVGGGHILFSIVLLISEYYSPYHFSLSTKMWCVFYFSLGILHLIYLYLIDKRIAKWKLQNN